jgi:hypothetical protein
VSGAEVEWGGIEQAASRTCLWQWRGDQEGGREAMGASLSILKVHLKVGSTAASARYSQLDPAWIRLTCAARTIF